MFDFFDSRRIHPRHHCTQQVCANTHAELEKKLDIILTEYQQCEKKIPSTKLPVYYYYYYYYYYVI